MSSGLIESLAKKLRDWAPMSGRGPHITEVPLLTSSELTSLRGAAASAHTPQLPRLQSSQPWLGEVNSVYRGSGYEFDENRLYGAGDETRFINWRLYARTGQLHTKVFHEEHRPELFVLLDRRSAMRFGTRRQLKVTQAARIACFHVYHARAHSMAVGGLLVQQPPVWLRRAQDESALDELINALIAPCPPVRQNPDAPKLTDMLRQSQVLLAPGATLVLISDFHDLRPEDAGTIWETARHHDLRAYRVTDLAEGHLPRSAEFALFDPSASTRVDLADLSAEALDEYELGFARHAELCQDVFAGAGVTLHSVTTADDVIPELQRTLDGTNTR